MPSYSPLTERIKGKGSEAWRVHQAGAKRAAAGEDIIFLSIGDPDFSTPEPIVERAVEALRGGDTHYSDTRGRTALREAIIDRFNSNTGLSMTAENVVILPGTQNALFAAAACLLGDADEVLSFEPMYVTYEATLQAFGASMVSVPMAADSGFRPNPQLIADAITPRTKAIALTTPNNPTGVIASRTELEGIAALAIEHDLWVIADEVYSELVFEGEHISIASLPGMAERTATVASLSKSHAMTGWRCGWIIGPTELTKHAQRLNMPMLYGIPGFVQEGALVGVENSDTIAAKMRDTYRKRRDLVADALADAVNMPILTPDAGMYVMADVRHFAMSSGEFSWLLLEKKGVSALDAGAFGPSAAGWLRLAYTVGEDQLLQACRRIVELTVELSA